MHSTLLGSRSGSVDEEFFGETETRDLKHSLEDGQHPAMSLQNLAADDAHNLGSFYMIKQKMCEKPTCCNWTCFMIMCVPALFVLIYCLVALILLWPVQPTMEAMYFRPYTVKPYFKWKAHEPVVFLNLSGGLRTEFTSHLGSDVDGMNVVFNVNFPDWVGNKVNAGKFRTKRGKLFPLRSKKKSNLTYWVEMEAIPSSVLWQTIYEELNKSRTIHFGLNGYGLVLIDWVFTKLTLHSNCWFKMNGSIVEENDWMPKPPKAEELYYGEYDDDCLESGNCPYDDGMALATNKAPPNDVLQRGEAQQYVDSGILKKNPFDIIEKLLNHTFKMKVVEQTCHFSLNNFEYWAK